MKLTLGNTWKGHHSTLATKSAPSPLALISGNIVLALSFGSGEKIKVYLLSANKNISHQTIKIKKKKEKSKKKKRYST